MHFLQIITYFELIIGIYTLLILLFLIIIYTLLKSVKEYRLMTRKNEWNTIIDQEIYEAILEENSDQNTEFNTYLKSTSFKHYFIKKLLQAEQNFTGNSKNNIQKLFDHYHLKKLSIKKLNSKNHYEIAEAIQEVTAMNLVETLPKIKTLVHHKNELVRLEAQYGLVKFSGFEGLYFLTNLQEEISDWHQLKLLNAIHYLHENASEKIDIWLQSTNKFVQIFAMKLIRKFQLLHMHSSVEKLITSQDEIIRNETIKTLISIENETTSTFLIQHFEQNDEAFKIQILKGLEQMANPENNSFLEEQALHNPSFSIKKSSIKAYIKTCSKEHLINLSNQSTSTELKQIINQFIQEN